jgi:2-polyprenyl-3-methyl-5-hydroxy-6-metoxy-1,4-benzoquinol methylase
MNSCPVCKSKRIKLRYFLKLNESLGNIVDFKILECNNCNLLFSNLLDYPRQMDSIYEEEYFQKYDSSFKNNPKIRSFQKALDIVGQMRYSSGKLLDFGCAEGNFLILAKKRGWQVYGVELSKFASNIAKKRGLTVFNESIHDVKFQDNFFDVITLWDVIEHLSDLEGIFTEFRRILKKDGLLIIRTPNKNSIFHILANLSYALSFKTVTFPIKTMYHPDHLYYFSRQTLNKTLNKNGFKIKKLIMTDQTTMYSKNKFMKLIIWPIRLIGILLGRQHSLLVMAKKNA